MNSTRGRALCRAARTPPPTRGSRGRPGLSSTTASFAAVCDDRGTGGGQEGRVSGSAALTPSEAAVDARGTVAEEAQAVTLCAVVEAYLGSILCRMTVLIMCRVYLCAVRDSVRDRRSFRAGRPGTFSVL